jgi:hypothetical protein
MASKYPITFPCHLIKDPLGIGKRSPYAALCDDCANKNATASQTGLWTYDACLRIKKLGVSSPFVGAN